jgi:tRNA (guanine-N7-)-methyltransferase
MKPSQDSENSDQFGLVSSSQTGVHPQLEKHLKRHLQSSWSQPLHQPSVEMFKQLKFRAALFSGAPVVLDSGCGTGSSSQRLADMFPEHLIIGVDQSLARLSKSGAGSGFYQNGNCVLLRAELSTFWRLLLEAGVKVERHYLLYPNPWPKSGHLQRRWHGHPVFPSLLNLGGEIELRCNWEIYAMEFARAVNLATGADLQVAKIKPESGISPFEQKYMDRGQTLYGVNVAARYTRDFLSSQKATQ